MSSQHLLLHLRSLKVKMKKKTRKKLKKFSILIPSMEILKPNPQPNRSSSASQSSVGNLDDF
jgi:hypothetical protein